MFNFCQWLNCVPSFINVLKCIFWLVGNSISWIIVALYISYIELIVIWIVWCFFLILILTVIAQQAAYFFLWFLIYNLRLCRVVISKVILEFTCILSDICKYFLNFRILKQFFIFKFKFFGLISTTQHIFKMEVFEYIGRSFFEIFLISYWL